MEYDQGIAFVCEGETERIFYTSFITHLSEKWKVDDFYIKYDDIGEEYYELGKRSKLKLIKFNDVSSITNITHSILWLKNRCLKLHPTDWSVYLCYDTDSYKNDISRFYKGDWLSFRDELKDVNIVDLAASADIEDIMLLDPQSISKYLKVDQIDIPKKANGKKKMKAIFRNSGKVYHEGIRAEKLIHSLDFNHIMENSPISFRAMETDIFSF